MASQSAHDGRRSATDTDAELLDPTQLDEAAATPKPRRGPGLTKVSANFTPRSMIALQAAAELSEDNQTDVINRSIQVYAYICKMEAEGKLLFAEDPATKTRERVVLL